MPQSSHAHITGEDSSCLVLSELLIPFKHGPLLAKGKEGRKEEMKDGGGSVSVK